MLWQFFHVAGGTSDAHGRRCTIGGQIVAYTNRLTRVSCDNIVKLGGAVGLKFNIGKIQYVSMGTYWPCHNDGKGLFSPAFPEPTMGFRLFPL